MLQATQLVINTCDYLKVIYNIRVISHQVYTLCYECSFKTTVLFIVTLVHTNFNNRNGNLIPGI